MGSPRVRAGMVSAYLLILTCGVALPFQLHLYQGIIEWLWLVMSAWMGFGGLVSALGQLAQRWVGEFVGLPMIGSALMSFGVLQANVQDWSWLAIPSTSLLWAFALISIERFRNVSGMYRASVRVGVRRT